MLDKKEHFGAILTDLSELFEQISHKRLVAKLDAYGFSKETLKLIFS